MARTMAAALALALAGAPVFAGTYPAPTAPATEPDICGPYERATVAESITALSAALDRAAEDIRFIQVALEEGLYLVPWMSSRPISFQEVVLMALANPSADRQADPDAWLEQELITLVRGFAVYRNQQRARRTEIEREQAALSECLDRLRLQASADRAAAMAGGGLTLRTDVAPSIDEWPFENRHVVITNSAGGVTYLWHNGDHCDLTHTFTLEGIPPTVQRGDPFTLTLSGTISGTCAAVGGSCHSARIELRAGAELGVDASRSRAVVGVPQAGHPATRECQVAVDSVDIPVVANSSTFMQLDLLVAHGSGSRLVARYEWRDDWTGH